MKRTLVVFTAVTMLLAACGVSPASQQALVVQQQHCAAGDQDACVAANNQALANQAEAANNAAIGASVAAALLGGIAAGVAVGLTAPQPVYVYPTRYWHH